MARLDGLFLSPVLLGAITAPLETYGVSEIATYPIYEEDGGRRLSRVLVACDTALVEVTVVHPDDNAVTVSHRFVPWRHIDAGLSCSTEVRGPRLYSRTTAELAIPMIGVTLATTAERDDPFGPFARAVLAHASGPQPV